MLIVMRQINEGLYMRTISLRNKEEQIYKDSRKALKPKEQRVFLKSMDNHPVYDRWKPIFVFLSGKGDMWI